MFRVRFKDTDFGVSFSFFAVTALIFLCTGSQTGRILISLMCCFFHELGHLFFMFLFGAKPQGITLYGGGIRITPGSDRLISKTEDIVILLAGCAVNFLAAAVSYAFRGLDFFCEVNILLGIFNLLPFKYFDGGRVLEMLFDGGAAYDVIRALFILMGAVAVILMNLNGIISVSFMMTFAFVVVSEILY